MHAFSSSWQIRIPAGRARAKKDRPQQRVLLQADNDNRTVLSSM